VEIFIGFLFFFASGVFSTEGTLGFSANFIFHNLSVTYAQLGKGLLTSAWFGGWACSSSSSVLFILFESSIWYFDESCDDLGRLATGSIWCWVCAPVHRGGWGRPGVDLLVLRGVDVGPGFQGVFRRGCCRRFPFVVRLDWFCGLAPEGAPCPLPWSVQEDILKPQL